VDDSVETQLGRVPAAVVSAEFVTVQVGFYT